MEAYLIRCYADRLPMPLLHPKTQHKIRSKADFESGYLLSPFTSLRIARLLSTADVLFWQSTLGSDSHGYGAEQKGAGSFQKKILLLSAGSDRTGSGAWSISWRYRTISDGGLSKWTGPHPCK